MTAEDQDAAVEAAVVADFLTQVTGVAPRLAADPARRAQLAGRAAAVLRLVHAELRGQAPPELSDGRQDVGPRGPAPACTRRSRCGRPGCCSGSRCPRCWPPTRTSPPERVAVVLHEVIDQLVVTAAASYVDVLLARISDANRDERRRVARDLHDHTSHGIGAAMQGVDLALHLLGTGQTPDVARLRATRQVLLDTLNDVRGMATRLRDVVGERSLGQALREYLDFTAPAGLDVRLVEEGEAARPLPPHVKEEGYLIVREAIRNSLVHGAGATRLDVAVVVADGRLVATVSDDGPGFDPAAVDTTRTVGLASQRERAEGLGGAVALDAGPGGVRMVLTVPLHPAAA